MITTAYQIYGSFVVYLWVYRSASSTPFGTINTLTSFVQFSTLLYRDDLPDTYKFMSPFLGDLQVEARPPPPSPNPTNFSGTPLLEPCPGRPQHPELGGARALCVTACACKRRRADGARFQN